MTPVGGLPRDDDGLCKGVLASLCYTHGKIRESLTSKIKPTQADEFIDTHSFWYVRTLLKSCPQSKSLAESLDIHHKSSSFHANSSIGINNFMLQADPDELPGVSGVNGVGEKIWICDPQGSLAIDRSPISPMIRPFDWVAEFALNHPSSPHHTRLEIAHWSEED